MKFNLTELCMMKNAVEFYMKKLEAENADADLIELYSSLVEQINLFISAIRYSQSTVT